ncbi:sigma factor for late transcription [Pectobacterium phage POP12]|nr:sigma factor for late transcription [Pectobacterium phage POP12]
MKKNIYANNDVLYPALCAWKKQLNETGNRKMPDILGSAIMNIANGLIHRWNFNGYSEDWKLDMVDDGIEAAIAGLHNYDETQYTNVYGYINKTCWMAFVGRIMREKKETAKKYRFFLENVYDSGDEDLNKIADENFIQDMHDKLNQYEKSANKVKETKIADESPTLEMFYD